MAAAISRPTFVSVRRVRRVGRSVPISSPDSSSRLRASGGTTAVTGLTRAIGVPRFDRLEDGRLAGIVAKGLAQVGNGSRQGRLAQRLEAPHAVEEYVLRENLARVTGQEHQQINDLGAKAYTPAIAGNLTAPGLDQPGGDVEGIVQAQHSQRPVGVRQGIEARREKFHENSGATGSIHDGFQAFLRRRAQCRRRATNMADVGCARDPRQLVPQRRVRAARRTGAGGACVETGGHRRAAAESCPAKRSCRARFG